LVAEVRGDAWLDAAGTDGNQSQSQCKTKARFIEREGEMPKAVEDREPKNGTVLPEESIRENRADQGEGIQSGAEEVERRLRVGLGHGVELTLRVHEILRHKNDEDRPHPIVGESLRAFIADDVGNAGGIPGRASGAVAYLWLGMANCVDG
jgi:hypothetical protein